MPGRVLVVEDDSSASHFVGYTLEEAGYEVLTASNGIDGLKMARSEGPHLLVLDVLLPGIDGFEVCHRLRSDPQTRDLPILIFSAKARDADKAVGLRVGADAYLAKPADSSALLGQVEKLIARKARGGRTIAFVGCRSGTGVSNVAVNVAVTVAQKGRHPLLLDPCPKFDAVPSLLGLDTRQGVTKFFNALEGSSDGHGIVASSITHYTGLKVLYGFQAAREGEEMTASDIRSLLREIRGMADHAFIDVSGEPPDVWKAALESCDLVVLVTDSGPDGLDNAKETATLLATESAGNGRKVLVVVDRDGALSDVEFTKMRPVVESSVGIPLLALIPQDLKIPLQFEAQGLPIALADANRPAAAALRQLAEQLIEFDFSTTTGNVDTGAEVGGDG